MHLIGAAIAAPVIGASLPVAGPIDTQGMNLLYAVSGGNVGYAKWLLLECSKCVTHQGLTFDITYQKAR